MTAASLTTAFRAKPDVAEGQPALHVESVDKSYGRVRAVTGLSMTVGRGEMVALLGPNGAGKTTTISMLLGLAQPDRGRIEILGGTPAEATAGGKIGAMLQDGGLMRGVLVRELLAMLAQQYASPAPLADVYELAEISDIAGRRVDRLSGGQAQRVRLAMALVGAPELLILDEPTAAMDVEARRSFWSRITELAAAGRTVLFSTHYLEEADQYARRVIVMRAGQVVADGTPTVIKAAVGLRAVRFSSDQPERANEGLPGVTALTRVGQRFELRSSDTDATLRALLARDPTARDINVGDLGLEDAFVVLTTADRAA
jgi:ABC-2 type transport system ATP-binding protein